ncbi:TPA: hypothetical protein HA243_03645 [Candidatus Micrarchaeota archaeon]|nr:hypothetical protein [Candidatus Micrarchaeota archaeon]
MTMVNFDLGGALEKYVLKRIRMGYATSKAEVIRSALVRSMQQDDFEDISDDPELEKWLMDVKSGKIKPKFLGPVKDLKHLMK